MHVLNGLWERTRLHSLCLAGGCAMNSVANGKIRRRTPFTAVYVQPAAGDNGTALGAAYLAGLAVGYWKDQTTIAAQWGAEHTFKPGMRKGARSGLRARWKKALRRAKGWADK